MSFSMCASLLAQGLQADAGQLSLEAAEPLRTLWSLPCILDLGFESEVELKGCEYLKQKQG